VSLEGFVEALDLAGLDLDADNLRDCLWLASRGRTLSLLSPRAPEKREEAGPSPAASPPPLDGGDSAPPDDRPSPDRDVEADPAASEPPVAVFPKVRPSLGDRTIKATPVAIPAGRSLAHRLEVMRAMRPFCQRWPSRQFSEIDEEQTVEATAQWGRLVPGLVLPVFRRREERWFDVELVAEDDDAIEVWAETLRDFCQVLRDTGAFRSVRAWRLRMAADAGEPSRTVLENATGAQVPVGHLTGAGVRRLVIFATHGASVRWLDGSYADVLAHWLRDCSAMMLQLTPADRWSQTRLGEAHGRCSASQPGAVAAALDVHPDWWNLDVDPEDKSLLPLPVVPLAPAALDEWAHMQMSRGRQSPVYLLDPTLRTPPRAALAPMSLAKDFQRAIDELGRVSPKALQLAVWLSPTAFTIPVARLVQDSQFGASTDQRALADLLQSGLVYASTRREDNSSSLQYDFKDGAREILMRSLRDEDAKQVARDLRRRVSEYISTLAGSANTSEQLVPDERGSETLPDWAEPFADAEAALLGMPRGAGERRAVPSPQEARPGDEAEPAEVLPPAGSELEGLSILWVDDIPANNAVPERQLRDAGARVVQAASTRDAMVAVARERFAIVISDMARGDEPAAGLDLLRQLQATVPELPVIIYAGRFARDREQVALDAGAFGCTDRPDALHRLVLEAARTPWARSARSSSPRLGRVRKAFADVGAPLSEVEASWVEDSSRAGVLAERLLAAQADNERCYQNHVRVVEAFAEATLTRLVLVEGRQLVVAASRQAEGMAPPARVVSWNRLVEQVVSQGQTIWLDDRAGLPAIEGEAPTAGSALGIPLLDHRDGSRVAAVLDIDMAAPRALSRAQIDWLSAFVAPIGRRVPTRSPATWLSCADADRPVAERLMRELEAKHRPVDLLESEAQLNVSDAILLLGSSSSMSADGLFPAGSLAGREEFRSLVVVFIPGAPVPSTLTQGLSDAVDLRSDHEAGVERLAGLLAPGGGPAEHVSLPGGESKDTVAAGRQLQIVYATNRNVAQGKDDTIAYGPKRGAGLVFGIGEVSIPNAHRIGVVERPSMLRMQFTVDRARHFDLANLEPVVEGRLLNSLLPAMGNKSRSALLFVPGFNVDFETALFRTAQLAFDLRLDASPMLFSWPSQAKASAYLADQQEAQASASMLHEWLTLLGRSLSAVVHLWADGLGAQALLRALSLAPELRFGQIVLTFPDMDLDAFASAASQIAKSCERVTVYVAENGGFSVGRTLSGTPRAGGSVRVIRGVDTVYVAKGRTPLPQFSPDRATLADIRDVLADRPASARLGLRSVPTPEGIFWMLGDGAVPATSPARDDARLRETPAPPEVASDDEAVPTPRFESDPPASSTAATVQGSERATRSVHAAWALVAHPEPDLRELITEALHRELEGLHARVVEVTNATEARKRFESLRPEECVIAVLGGPMAESATAPRMEDSTETLVAALNRIRPGLPIVVVASAPNAGLVQTVSAWSQTALVILGADFVSDFRQQVRAVLHGPGEHHGDSLELKIFFNDDRNVHWTMRRTGRSPFEQTGSLDVDFAELHRELLAFRRAIAQGDGDSSWLVESTRWLHKTVFGDRAFWEPFLRVRERSGGPRGTRTALFLPRPLAHLPVEAILRDRAAELGNCWALNAPVFRSVPSPVPGRPLFQNTASRSRLLTCLLIEADGRGGFAGEGQPFRPNADLARSAEAVVDTLRSASVEVTHLRMVDFSGDAAEGVVRALQEGPWDMVHYCGDLAGNSLEEAMLPLNGRAEDAVRMMNILPFLRTARFVFLGASSSVSPEIQLDMGQQIPAVLGVQWAIPESVLADFGRRFYESLFKQGQTGYQDLAQAVASARRAAFLAQPHAAHWASPTLTLSG
jgi:esterase/lipase superfamily enzyme/CheY-like chemotaxis protein